MQKKKRRTTTKSKSFELIIACVICLIIGFFVGKTSNGISTGSQVLYETEIKNLSLKRIELEMTIAQMKVESISDKKSITDLYKTSVMRAKKLLDVSNQLYFYEQVIAPNSAKAGINIYSFSIAKAPEGDKWEYELILTQSQKNRSFLSGSFALQFTVLDGKEKRHISLNKLDHNSPSTFKFKYYQTLKGDFVLPKNYKPEEALLSLRVKGRRKQNVKQNFTWDDLIGGDKEEEVGSGDIQ